MFCPLSVSAFFFFKLQIQPKYFPSARLLATEETFSSDIRTGEETDMFFAFLRSMKSDLEGWGVCFGGGG